MIIKEEQITKFYKNEKRGLVLYKHKVNMLKLDPFNRNDFAKSSDLLKSILPDFYSAMDFDKLSEIYNIKVSQLRKENGVYCFDIIISCPMIYIDIDTIKIEEGYKSVYKYLSNALSHLFYLSYSKNYS